MKFILLILLILTPQIAMAKKTTLSYREKWAQQTGKPKTSVPKMGAASKMSLRNNILKSKAESILEEEKRKKKLKQHKQIKKTNFVYTIPEKGQNWLKPIK